MGLHGETFGDIFAMRCVLGGVLLARGSYIFVFFSLVVERSIAWRMSLFSLLLLHHKVYFVTQCNVSTLWLN